MATVIIDRTRRVATVGIGGVVGPQGPTGPVGATGATGPKGDTGDTGPQGPEGPQGPQGIQGIQGIQGETGPQGIQGETGPQGPAGADGADGSVWYEGTGTPSGATGVDGDFYLDDATGDVYQKASGTWGVVANIKGPTGASGSGSGDVVGPASSTAGNFASFLDASGKEIADSGYDETSFAAASHSHAISDVTNLQTTLDGKATTSHTHAISDVTNLQTTLDGKAASSHTHAIADVTNLQTTLDGKAASSHTHTLSDITDTGNVAVSASRSLTASDLSHVLVCTGTITLTVPDLGGGGQVGVLNVGSGIVTIEGDAGVTLTLDPVLLDNTDVPVTTATLIETAAGVWAVVTGTRPQTFTVVYDAGWPASRPDADHVHAIGHTSAPSWLTADDVWFEDVS